jgi:hypothetical protein
MEPTVAKNDAEQYIEWNQLTRHQLIVAHMTLINTSADMAALRMALTDALVWFQQSRPQWGPGTLPTWYTDACELLRKSERE